ncbi:hypothetical protein JCM1840_005627 [Sporobolomyces johnsonii]
MPPSGPPPLNDNPFAAPDFLAGLEAAGYLQRLDTSEARITARYQHALAKMQFAAHSEEFLTRAGVKKVHRSTVQFFSEEPTPMDPFVHVMVGSLPPSRQALVTPRGCETSGWTPIGSPDEADGTIHFTVSYPGFWPITVVFDCNQSDLPKEDKYASLRAAHDDSDSDPEAYLSLGTSSGRYAQSGSRRQGFGGLSSSAGGTYGYDAGAGRSSGRAGRSGSRYAADNSSSSGSDSGDDDATAGGAGTYGSIRRGSIYSAAGNGYGRSGGGGGGDYGRSGGGGGGAAGRSSRASRRGTAASAADIGDIGGIGDGMTAMSLGRSASRSGMRASSRAGSRRSSYAAGY